MLMAWQNSEATPVSDLFGWLVVSSVREAVVSVLVAGS